MKTHLFSALLVISAMSVFSQVPAIKWQKSLGGPGIDKGNAVVQSTDGGFVIAGESTSTGGDITGNNGNSDYWVAKIDTAGLLVWQKSLGGSGEDRANGITATSDGGYLVVGSAFSPVSGDITLSRGLNDVWLVKLTAAGTISWQKSLGGTGVDEARSVQQTADGGYIIAGDSRSNNFDLTANAGQADFWVVKTDATGTIQWQKSLGGSGTDNGYAVQQTSDGGYVVCGQTDSNNGDVSGNNGGVDFWVIKLSSTGTVQWQKCLGGTGTDAATCIKQTSDGGFIVGGRTGSNNGNVTGNNGAENVWVAKLSSTGTLSWQKCYGGNGFDACKGIQQTADGGYIFAGEASSNINDVSGNHGSYDYWVVKVNSTGTIVWQKCLGGSSSDSGAGIQITSDNGYVVAGRSASSAGDITNPKGLDDYWVVRFMGVVSTPTTPGTGIIPINAGDQLSIYPNPSNGQITILVNSGASNSEYKVTLTDALGRLVYENRFETTTATIDISKSAKKGIYFLSVLKTDGSLLELKKVTIE